MHVDGRVLGRHDGVIRYTVGQRRGLGIAAGEPLFVVRLDAEHARVIVGPREALATRSHRAARLQLARRGDPPAAGGARASSRASARRARRLPLLLAFDGDRPVVHLAGEEMGVAPGQACVLYDSDGADARILGGGTIASRVAGSERAEAA